MKSLLVCALLLAAVMCARPKWHQLKGYTFEKYTKDFHKVYAVSERQMREKIFSEKLAMVTQHNSEGHSWKKGINHLSDRSKEELLRLRGNLPVQATSKPERIHKVSGVQLPNSIDYRTAFPPILTAVKDQGECGSCWAHASTEELESMYAVATGELFVLSQQQLTSCVQNTQQCGGTGGCAGATAEVAFDYVVANGGVTQEWMYGYTSYFGDSGVCKYNSGKTSPVMQISGYTLTERNNATAVMDALAHAGPLAISVDASEWSDYESGVYSGCTYNISMDHAVQLVGYGKDSTNGLDYWLVRNSWSPAWGEDGFIRLVRETGAPQCGWNNDWDTNGGGCKGQPNTIWACGQCGILYDTLYPNAIKP